MTIEILSEDKSDIVKSSAKVTIGAKTAIVSFWSSMRGVAGSGFDTYLLASAHVALGNVSEAVKILTPLATGEDTRFYNIVESADGVTTSEFGGQDTRNWAKQMIDEI